MELTETTSSRAYYKKENRFFVKKDPRKDLYPETTKKSIRVSCLKKAREDYNNKMREIEEVKIESSNEEEETDEEWMERMAKIYNTPEYETYDIEEDTAAKDEEWKEWAENAARSKN